MNTAINRRQHERFSVAPMYSSIAVRPIDQASYTEEGHAYDISETGVCFDLDRGYAPGTELAMRIDLSEMHERDQAPNIIFVVGKVVWADDDEVNGPVRMALSVNKYPREGDREKLVERFGAGKLRRAA